MGSCTAGAPTNMVRWESSPKSDWRCTRPSTLSLRWSAMATRTKKWSTSTSVTLLCSSSLKTGTYGGQAWRSPTNLKRWTWISSLSYLQLENDQWLLLTMTTMYLISYSDLLQKQFFKFQSEGWPRWSDHWVCQDRREEVLWGWRHRGNWRGVQPTLCHCCVIVLIKTIINHLLSNIPNTLR